VKKWEEKINKKQWNNQDDMTEKKKIESMEKHVTSVLVPFVKIDVLTRRWGSQDESSVITSSTIRLNFNFNWFSIL
jgi:hypothetical protein